MAVSEQLSQGRVVGDIIKYVEHPAINYVSGKVVGAAGQASVDANLCGQPIKASGANYIFVLSADIANAIGIFAHDKPITLAASAVSEWPYKLLIRGDALVDKDSLPTTDVVGTGITNSSFVIALAARGIIAQSQPVLKQAQTS
jgi:hypothetical protein